MICDAPPIAVGPVPPLTTKSIIATYAGNWYGKSPTWVPGTTKILVKRAGPEFSSDGSIELYDTRDGSCSKIGTASVVVPSPDGSRFAMIGRVDGVDQLWVQNADGSRNFVTHFANGVGGARWAHSLVWSPDGTQIAFGFQGSAQMPPLSSQVTVTDYGAHGADPPDAQIMLIDARSGEIRPLGGGPYDPDSFSWDDNHVVFAAVHYGNRYSDGKITGEIRSIDLSTGQQSVLLAHHGVQELNPVAIPHSRQVYFLDSSDPDYYYPENLNVATLGSDGTVRQLTTNSSFPHLISGPLAVDPIACGTYFIGKVDVYRHVFRVDCAGTIRQVDEQNANVDGYSLSADGRSLAVIAEDALERVHLRVVSTVARGRLHDIADLRPDVSRLQLGAAKVISWKAQDGVINSGLVILPRCYRAGKKYPLIVDVHGGPVGGVSLYGSLLIGNPLEWHLLASRGFIVLVPDYRSSLVSGWDTFMRGIEKQDFNERDMDDIMSGVDFAIASYGADPGRMALYGHSNGGYETNWLITHTHRFKVAISLEGFADWYIGWSSGSRIGGNPSTTFEMRGKPWEVPENYLHSSPDMAVKGVTTPTMFISGSDGIALYHNEFMYGALLGQQIPTDFLVYRGEGHTVEKPQNLRDLLDRSLAWIDKYL